MKSWYYNTYYKILILKVFVMDKYMREHYYFEGIEEIKSPEKKRNTT